MPSTPTASKPKPQEEFHIPANHDEVARVCAELRKNPKVVFAENVPRGWQVFAKPVAKGEVQVSFVAPTGKLLEDFKLAHRFLTQNPRFAKGTPQEMEPGIWIEAEMQETDSAKTEWLKGRVLSVNKKKGEFKARFEVENLKEKGGWDETYTMKEEGKEWRWPRFTSADLEPFVEEAMTRCDEASGVKRKKLVSDADADVEAKEASAPAPQESPEESSSSQKKAGKGSRDPQSKKSSKVEPTSPKVSSPKPVRPFASAVASIWGGGGDAKKSASQDEKASKERNADSSQDAKSKAPSKKKQGSGTRRKSEGEGQVKEEETEEGGECGEEPTAWSKDLNDGGEGSQQAPAPEEHGSERMEGTIKVGANFYAQEELDRVVEEMGGYAACCAGTTGGLGGGGGWIEAARMLGQNTAHYKRASSQLRIAYETAHGLGAPKQAAMPQKESAAVDVEIGAQVEVLEGVGGEGEATWAARVVVSASRAKGLFRVEGSEDVFFNVKERGVTWKWPGEAPASPAKRGRSDLAMDGFSPSKRARAKSHPRLPGEVDHQVRVGDQVDVRSASEEEGWQTTRVLRAHASGASFKVEVPEGSGLPEKYLLTDEGKTWRWSLSTLDITPAGGRKGVASTPRARGGAGAEQTGNPYTGAVVMVRVQLEDGKKKWRKARVKRVSHKRNEFKWEAIGKEPLEGLTAMGDTKWWRWPKRDFEDGAAEPEPCVGASVEVLFDDGLKYPGIITRKGPRAGSWHIHFEDGDSDDMDWPDPEVRVTSVPTRKQKKGGGSRGVADPRIQLWSLLRVVFDSGVYLGKVTAVEARPDGSKKVEVAYEDGFVDSVDLPDPDVQYADTEQELTAWLAENEPEQPDEDEEGSAEQQTGAVRSPWWFDWPVRHSVEDAPETIRSVVIRPPARPKSKRGRRKKATLLEGEGAADDSAMQAADETAMGRKEGAEERGRKAQRATGGDEGESEKPAREGSRGGRKAGKRDAGKEEDGSKREGEQEEKSRRKAQKKDSDRAAQRSSGGGDERKKESGTGEEKEKKKKVKRSDSELSRGSSTKGDKSDPERSALIARNFGIRKDLERLLLQDVPEELLTSEQEETDWLDPVCVCMMPTDALNTLEFCLLCGSAATPEDTIFCRDCGDCFHLYCLHTEDGQLKIPMDKRHMWRCPACRICECCQGEENWEQMVLCDECDRGFHMYCLKPPMKQVPTDGWRCSDCRQCVSCKRTNSTKWYKDHKVCATCWPQFKEKSYCKMCKKVYKDSDMSIKMLCCDSCDFWVHISCAGVDEEKYKAMTKQDSEVEWHCPKCKGDVEVSDDEQDEKVAPLANPDRVVQIQQQLEEFCTNNLKALIKSCEAWERNFRPPAEEKEKPKPALKNEGKESPLAASRYGRNLKRVIESPMDLDSARQESAPGEQRIDSTVDQNASANAMHDESSQATQDHELKASADGEAGAMQVESAENLSQVDGNGAPDSLAPRETTDVEGGAPGAVEGACIGPHDQDMGQERDAADKPSSPAIEPARSEAMEAEKGQTVLAEAPSSASMEASNAVKEKVDAAEPLQVDADHQGDAAEPPQGDASAPVVPLHDGHQTVGASAEPQEQSAEHAAQIEGSQEDRVMPDVSNQDHEMPQSAPHASDTRTAANAPQAGAACTNEGEAATAQGDSRLDTAPDRMQASADDLVQHTGSQLEVDSVAAMEVESGKGEEGFTPSQPQPERLPAQTTGADERRQPSLKLAEESSAAGEGKEGAPAHSDSEGGGGEKLARGPDPIQQVTKESEQEAVEQGDKVAVSGDRRDRAESANGGLTEDKDEDAAVGEKGEQCASGRAAKVAKPLTEEEKAALAAMAEKLSAISAVKKELVRLERGLEKHKYQKTLPFFDDLLYTLSAQDAECIASEVQQLRAQASDLFSDATGYSELTESPMPEPEILTRRRTWATLQIKHAWSYDAVQDQQGEHANADGAPDPAGPNPNNALPQQQYQQYQQYQLGCGPRKKGGRPAKKAAAPVQTPAPQAVQARVAGFVNSVRLASTGPMFTEFKDSCQKLHLGQMNRETFTAWFTNTYKHVPELPAQLAEVLRLMQDRGKPQAPSQPPARQPKPKPQPAQPPRAMPMQELQQTVIQIAKAIQEGHGTAVYQKFLAEVQMRPKPVSWYDICVALKTTFHDKPHVFETFLKLLPQAQQAAQTAPTMQNYFVVTPMHAQPGRPHPGLPQAFPFSPTTPGTTQAFAAPANLLATSGLVFSAPAASSTSQGATRQLNVSAAMSGSQHTALAAAQMNDTARWKAAIQAGVRAGLHTTGGVPAGGVDASAARPAGQKPQAGGVSSAGAGLHANLQQQHQDLQKMQALQARVMGLTQQLSKATAQAQQSAGASAQKTGLPSAAGTRLVSGDIPSVQAQPYVVARVDGVGVQQPLVAIPAASGGMQGVHLPNNSAAQRAQQHSVNGNGAVPNPMQPPVKKPKRQYIKKADKERMAAEAAARQRAQAQPNANANANAQASPYPQHAAPPQQRQPQQQPQPSHQVPAQTSQGAQGAQGTGHTAFNGQQSFNMPMSSGSANAQQTLQSIGLMPPMPVSAGAQTTVWQGMQKALGINAMSNGLFPGMSYQQMALNLQRQQQDKQHHATPASNQNPAEALPQMDGAGDDPMEEDEGKGALPQLDGADWDEDLMEDGPVGYEQRLGDDGPMFGDGMDTDKDEGSGWAGSRLSNDFKRGGPDPPEREAPAAYYTPQSVPPSVLAAVGPELASKMFPSSIPLPPAPVPVPLAQPSAPVSQNAVPLPAPASSSTANPTPVKVPSLQQTQAATQAVPSPTGIGYERKVCQIGGVKVSRDVVIALVNSGDCGGRKDSEGNIYVNWAAVAQRLGIDTKSNHSYGKKLKDLYTGSMVQKRPTPVTPARSYSAHSAATRELSLGDDGGKVSVDSSLLENPFMKQVKISGADGRKDPYIFHAPERVQIQPRKGGLLARKPLLRRAAERVQQLWVYTIHEAINRSETAQKAAKKKKQKQVEGWDMKQLARLIEACATALGVVQLKNGTLRLGPKAHRMNLMTDYHQYAQNVKRALCAVSKDASVDIRYCVLCKITGDRPVQGRLLYVEKACWVHANCICWSAGVYMNYKVKPERLCKVHDTVRKAQNVACSFCGCPGATVACSNPGCCQVMHFGCAVMCEFTWFPLCHAFCSKCKEKPFVKKFKSTFQHDALTPLDFHTFLNRHLHIMPRSKPRVDSVPKKRKLPAIGPSKDASGTGTKPPRSQQAPPTATSPSKPPQAQSLQSSQPSSTPAPNLPPAVTAAQPAPIASGQHSVSGPAQQQPTTSSIPGMPPGAVHGMPPSAVHGTAAPWGVAAHPSAARELSAEQVLSARPSAQPAGALSHAQNIQNPSGASSSVPPVVPGSVPHSTASMPGQSAAVGGAVPHGAPGGGAVVSDGARRAVSFQEGPEPRADQGEGGHRGGGDGKEEGGSAQRRVGKAGGKPGKKQEEVALAMAEREEREREERERELAEELDAYESNQVTNLANDMQQGSAIARVGSLTVHRLGKIRTDNDAFHSELAIYPVGYLSTRLYFAPGEMPIKGGPPMRRCMYRCQILNDEENGRPLFSVTVNEVTHTAHVASEAWEKASQRKLRERKKLRVHANEGQCDNVTEMFMACTYAIDGDYMFGVTLKPIAKALEALKEAPMLFNYNQRFEIWGKNYVRPNPTGCARSEPFKRRKKMSTAKVHRNAEEGDENPKKDVAEAELNATRLRQLYHSMKAEPRAIVRRSPIHNFGLFATRHIDKHDMVIEYVGELVRALVGDMRDDIALEKGKSTYMFRIDDEHIVDAMFQGNASRYINHCCQPNCYCKVVTVDGVKHIVLFALRDIKVDEEITYDYKLPIEDVKVICQCGAPQCRGYLN